MHVLRRLSFEQKIEVANRMIAEAARVSTTILLRLYLPQSLLYDSVDLVSGQQVPPRVKLLN